MRAGLRKVADVAALEVSYGRRLASLKLRPGNRVTLSEIRRAVRWAHLKPAEATLVAVGVVDSLRGGPALRIGEEVFAASGLPEGLPPGARVAVRGEIGAAGQDDDASLSIRVTSAEAAGP